MVNVRGSSNINVLETGIYSSRVNEVKKFILTERSKVSPSNDILDKILLRFFSSLVKN